MGFNIAMVTDFFYPQPGGVEFHVYHLSQRLINRGHLVVIVTHSYGDRVGIRVLTNGLKVYYVPFWVVARSSILPSAYVTLPIMRNIFIRESIDIVHGHATYLTMCHEAIFHARTMGLRTVFTDHLLFGFDEWGFIAGNKLLKFTLTDVGHVIAVSHTCKENTVLRASLDPLDVLVIPNAVLSRDFMPSPSPKKSVSVITIVVISRLFPNKGLGLLTAIIPRVCAARPNVNFLIAGDGPKFLDLEQVREKFDLQDRVTLLGAVKHEQVRDVMVQGQIYLHPSLTEAFGTVIIEAASCGLYVVTTRVGGIPEVLPGHMTSFAEPVEDSLVETTLAAIDAMSLGAIDTSGFHQEVAQMYSWDDIALRTENVYNSLDLDQINQPLIDRLEKYYCCGVIAGKLFVLVVVVDIMLYMVLEWIYPRLGIDLVTKWPKQKESKSEDTFGINETIYEEPETEIVSNDHTSEKEGGQKELKI